MMNRKINNRSAFTLIEMLVVILVLGILAMIIVPQLFVSIEDAKLNTLKSSLNAERRAIESYYAQHNNTYPGVNNIDGSSKFGKKEGTNEDAYLAQMYQYTDVNGVVSNLKDATHKYGPYLKGPETAKKNPYNNLYDLKCETKKDDITERKSDDEKKQTGWKFYTVTGVFMANDGDHDNF
jgi:prepilin-type N-terminal cleavage/methylation domain-containing protein